MGRPSRATADPAKPLQSRTRPATTAQASDSDSDAEAWSRAASRPQPAAVRAPSTATIPASRRGTGEVASVGLNYVKASTRLAESEDSDDDIWKAATVAGPPVKAARATRTEASGAAAPRSNAAAARPSAPQAQTEAEDSDEDMGAAAAGPRSMPSGRVTESAMRRKTGTRQDARSRAAPPSGSALLPRRRAALREVPAMERPARPDASSSPPRSGPRVGAGMLPLADMPANRRATAAAAAAADAEAEAPPFARRRTTAAAAAAAMPRALWAGPARGDTFPPSAKPPPPPPDRRATAAAAPDSRLSLPRAIASRGSFDPSSAEPSAPAERRLTEAETPLSQLPLAAHARLTQHDWTFTQMGTSAQMPENIDSPLYSGYAVDRSHEEPSMPAPLQDGNRNTPPAALLAQHVAEDAQSAIFSDPPTDTVAEDAAPTSTLAAAGAMQEASRLAAQGAAEQLAAIMRTVQPFSQRLKVLEEQVAASAAAPTSLAAALEGRLAALETQMHRTAAAAHVAPADTPLQERLASLEARVAATQPAARSEAQAPHMADLASRPTGDAASSQGTVPLPSVLPQVSVATVGQPRRSAVDAPALGPRNAGDNPGSAGPAPVMSRPSPAGTPHAVGAGAVPCAGTGSMLCQQGGSPQQCTITSMHCSVAGVLTTGCNGEVEPVPHQNTPSWSAADRCRRDAVRALSEALMKHVRLMRAEQVSVQQRLCRLELTGHQSTNGKTVRIPSTPHLWLQFVAQLRPCHAPSGQQ